MFPNALCVLMYPIHINMCGNALYKLRQQYKNLFLTLTNTLNCINNNLATLLTDFQVCFFFIAALANCCLLLNVPTFFELFGFEWIAFI